MKKFGHLSVVLTVLLFAALLVGCNSADESSQPTPRELAKPSVFVPTAAVATAIAPTAVVPTEASEPVATPVPEPDEDVENTDVVSVVIMAAEATLYAGPGEDYPVVATAIGGSNYPVTGISKDGLWWRLTCFGDSAMIVECWVPAEPPVSMPAESMAMSAGSEIKPYIELTFNFLRAVQSGLTAAGSAGYLSRDLQAIVVAGRPLPSLFGIRDALPSFATTDFSDPRAVENALVRVRFNYSSPTYAIINLIQEEGEWQIDKVAAHNLVKTFSTGELVQAESVLIAYFEALANDDSEAAYKLLTADGQNNTSPQALSSIADGLEKLTVSTLQPVRGSADQLVYYVRLLARPGESQSAVQRQNWRDGENARWITLVQNKDGWRIAQVINSPILTGIESWQRVNVPPINMTLDIPADWTRAGLQWAWSPNSLGVPGVGVRWAELGEFDGDETLLPRYRRGLGTRPIDLSWAQGTQYTFELMAGPDDEPIAAESHMIVRTGRRAYDFYATATEVEELDNLRSILQRMVAAVSITDPQASAFDSVETSVNFLATLLRDATGASSLPYLGEALRAGAGDRPALLALLGAEDIFQSFNASWLGNPAAGQANVGVTLNYADSTEKLVFTVERNSEGLWLISEVEMVD